MLLFSFFLNIFLCQGYELSGEIALKNNHYYYYYYYYYGKGTKLLQNIPHLGYSERLAALNLPTLVYRRIRGDMIETFKILNNIYDSRVTNFLSISNFSTTRGHNFKLFVQHANFNIRKWFFSIRIVDIWNRLPSNVVNASNDMCFEKRLDKCWADLKIKFYHEAPLSYSLVSTPKLANQKILTLNTS